ncbi:hypothetical protein Ddye_027872 [Dipteronia dyeriana]|uniref:Disease resistance N-terminal domain-containing protein n=1 Tax=Dipteronia dyeriana TaxID=168575 RepID=A0AAD9TQD8_9ROSI|nr:hypothetical protein Ddye_027872 [Dipteronia dyeriana]
MPVVELLVSAFLPVLLERLTSPELLRFLRQEGLYSKIKKWEDALKYIQAVLGDAEEKQFKNSAVEMWLDDLRDLAYDVEDILDEFATEAFARKLKMEQHDQPSTSKIRKFVPSCFRNLSPRAIKVNRVPNLVTSFIGQEYRLCWEMAIGILNKNICIGVLSLIFP